MNAPAVVLSEIDVELALLGSIFMSPGAFNLLADDIRPEWFSDQFGRYLFEAALKTHQSGSRLSPLAVVSALPERCGVMSRGEFYAHACASAVPPNAIGGLVHTLKDRWARRELLASADAIRAGANAFEVDPYELAGETVSALDTINAHRSTRVAGTLDDGVRLLIDSLEHTERLKGPTTGLLTIDAKLNGYKAGQLYVIAGRPGMGKSAFMCSSLRRTAQAGHGVAIFSLEMGEEEIAARCMSDAIDNLRAPFFGSILKGLLSKQEREDLDFARESFAGIPLYVDASPRLTFSEITGRARKTKSMFEAQGHKLEVLCIDHMGLVTPSDRYKGNKVAEAGEVSGAARALAKELGCCVVLLCQLSREVEKRDDKKPQMSDLRWSGEIEQDAHVIGFLYREAYYLAQDAGADPYQMQDAKHKLEFLIRKNRNGETADVRLWCSIGHSSIRDQL